MTDQAQPQDRWKILFVDDERSFLEGIRLMLRGHRREWDMEFVTSVDEARERIRATEYDVIVSDVTMGNSSGIDFLASLATGDPEETLPVIMLTGNAERDLKRTALDLGAADLLNKPVTQEDLVARIRSIGRLRQYQKRLRNYTEDLHREVRNRTKELERSRKEIIFRLARAGEFRDEETGDHVKRVAHTSRVLSEALGLNSTLTDQIFTTSPLHDLGKIGIPDSILLKPGPLTVEERAIMQTHCVIGGRILTDNRAAAMLDFGADEIPESVWPSEPLQARAFEIALTHHEKWDGTGYPRGLRGDEIPVAGLVVALCDVYDALRSERPYKRAMPVGRVLEVLREGRGNHFAPHVVDAFINIAPEFEVIRETFSDSKPSEIETYA